MGKASLPVKSLWPGTQPLDSKAIKPAQELSILKNTLTQTADHWLFWQWLTTILSCLLFLILLLPLCFLQIFLPPTPPLTPFLPPTQPQSPFFWAFPGSSLSTLSFIQPSALQLFSSARQTPLNSIPCLYIVSGPIYRQSLDQSGSGTRNKRRPAKKVRLASHFGMPYFSSRSYLFTSGWQFE